MNIKKILIANRSEIASRIIFTCKSLNIKTVAIYSKQDSQLPFVFQADQNYKLEKEGSLAYLEQDEIIDIAKKFKVDAIHPGYGFLSENYNFAQKVINSGIKWIGPSPKIIKKMGDKINARKIMQKNNIPIIPGKLISCDENEKVIKKISEKIGFPLILKDPLGGGGKGIKKVYNSEELIPAFNIVKSETSRLTKTKQILIEKYIEKAKHIEVQIAGDGKNFIHLYERECSVQRRHQKIIEEAPCNFIEKKILNKIYNSAINSAKAINYNNIGTVEFIVTPNEFYFLEMNTRLQVEHSVTEQTTGIDLVELQIEIAQNQKLEIKQKDIKQNNHSIECRIYSENPENNFIPSTGRIKNLIIPNVPFCRVDHNLNEKMEIPVFFDPMLAKITTWGKNRDKTIKNMLLFLNKLKIEGIKTNIEFLKKILNSKKFLSGKINTQSIEKNEIKIYKTAKKQNTEDEKEIALIISTILLDQKENNQNSCKTNKWRIQQWQ
ncbi:ATP-grasp domain-containing protein [Candidatus Dependentiae bacterium]|nr:ATP-grasp domain-containing protein [Candidatus Dependentiae bacterium]